MGRILMLSCFLHYLGILFLASHKRQSIMFDPNSLAEFSSNLLDTPVNTAELDQRLGLYRVFLKLYEHHRELLDEILELENANSQQRSRAVYQYVQGVVQGRQVYLTTNLARGKTQSLMQAQGIWLIGRDRKAALPIQDKRLSRRHAAIQYREHRGFYLIDLNSTNGTFVNGEPVRQQVLLKDGDRIRLGSLSFVFFICKAVQSVEVIPPEVLEQINLARSTNSALTEAPTMDEASVLPGEIDWESPISSGVEETSMFLKTPISVSEPLEPQLSAAQQSDILDRFLQRQIQEIHP
ncbi:FHA domain-containing protein [Pantanalinema rosaneae CENA516]|uniref:FHA domain-containing protein n=1 Tax=Pantanalinema rosaneae TaxID=1620701 RepID=UPI003D6F0B96